MPRRQTTHQKKHWGRRILITLLVIAAICGISVAFFPQINNTWRNANGGNDTPADKAVKATVIKALDSKKNGNVITDGVIDATTHAIDTTKMSTVMAAAQDQDTATKLLTQSGLNSNVAQLVTSALFKTSAFDGVRESLANGDYYGVYKAAKKLNNTDTTSLIGQ
ncbi:MAG: hypothetical protein LKJ69_12255 [Lactobacillus sp.]|jgi:hypothetical protein|nr:hypothetical protein [Lactobacillus sp.]MCI2034139.1 hypothetical protein [Lactobacillus sp.]